MTKNQSCSVCGSNIFKPHFDEDNRLIECNNCHMVTLTKELWATEANVNYYESARNYVASATTEEKLAFAKKSAADLASNLSNIIPVKRNKSWLDVGAHVGSLVEALCNLGYDAEGIEMNKELVALAQSQHIPIQEGDAEKLTNIIETSFSTISAIDVLEHVPNPSKFLQSVKTILVEGGYLVLEVPNIESFLACHHGMQWKYIDREHLHYFSPTTISKLLELNGFVVEKIYTYNPFIETMSTRKLLHYIAPKKLPGDRLSRPLKGMTHKNIPETKKIKQHYLRQAIKYVLIKITKLLKREDFIIVIARKK